MKFRSALMLAALAPSLALARPAPTTTPAPSPPAGDTEAWNRIRVDLNLVGGTPLPVYIDRLSDLTKGNFILLSDPSVDPNSIHLPPLRLRELPLGSAVQLLQELPGTDIKVEPDDNPAATVPTWRILIRAPEDGALFGPGGAPNGPQPPATEPASKPQIKLFPLGRILFGNDPVRPPSTQSAAVKESAEQIDQLLQLIDLTLSASAGDDPHAPRAQINYHAPTRTLIVRATPEQLAAIEQAITALAPDPADPKEAIARAVRDQQSAFDRQREVFTARMQSLENELAQTRSDLAMRQHERDEAVLSADRMAQALRSAKVPNPTTQP